MSHLRVLQLSNVSVVSTSASSSLRTQVDDTDIITVLTSVTQFPYLTALDLSENPWFKDASASKIHTQGKTLLPKLHTLNYSSTGLHSVLDISYWPHLHTLDLAFTQSVQPPRLDKTNNTHLTINMSNTRLVLQERWLSELTWYMHDNSRVSLDLRHNDFICMCSDAKPILLLQEARQNKPHMSYLDDVTCRVNNGSVWKSIISIREGDLCPTQSYDIVIFLVVICVVLCAMLIVCLCRGYVLINELKRWTVLRTIRVCTQAQCDVIPANTSLDAHAWYDVLISFDYDTDWHTKVK